MLADTLKEYGTKGEEVLRTSIAHLRATGSTEESIRSEVTPTSLSLFGRGFFSTLETGRGPRKSSQPGDFQDNMLAYMRARGIGSGLSDKKKKQLARFLTWKINKEGDKTHKAGGRQVYSQALNKFVDELKEAVKKDLREEYILEITKPINR